MPEEKNNLSNIVKMAGLNVKKLSEKANIPYSTLRFLTKTSPKKWTNEQLSAIATALNITTDELKDELGKTVLTPFIKWVGGKRQLLPELIKHIPKSYNTYYEPFIGGGALFLKIQPKKAVINDFNEELANAWEIVKNDNEKLRLLLDYYGLEDSKEFYLNLRSADRDGRIKDFNNLERAGRFIYLNKAGYNGLWRVNQKGQNNVPYGAHKTINFNFPNIYDVSDYLNRNDVEITSGDYKDSLSSATKDDFVYLDPPYIPVNPTSNFTSYTKDGFGLIQQQELAETALCLAKKGVKVMLSNADVPLIEKLYSDKIFNIHHVQANRVLNSNGKKRGKVGEVIITTY